MQIVFRQRHLEHDVAVAIDRDQVIENGKIRGGQAIAVRAQTFVHAVQVKQHHVRLRQFLQKSPTSSNCSRFTHTTGTPVRVG